jgi:hypothetical protein
MDKSRLLTMLADAGLERIVSEIELLMQPSIRLWLSPCLTDASIAPEVGRNFHQVGNRWVISDSAPTWEVEPRELPVGTSKVGGQPDLPPGFVWPYWQGRPIHFLAQFNMAEVAPYDIDHALPTSGMLYFFLDDSMEAIGPAGSYGYQEERGWKVFHHPGDLSALRRTPTPPGLPELFGELLPRAVRFEPEMTVPDDDSIEFQILAERLSLTDAEKETYWNFLIRMFDADEREVFGCKLPNHQHFPFHRLLGCPNVGYQDGRLMAVMNEDNPDGSNDPEMDAEAHRKLWHDRAVRSQAWRLLFQIDTDDAVGLDWGDTGTMFFFIRHDDLQSGNFENIWLEYEGL